MGCRLVDAKPLSEPIPLYGNNVYNLLFGKTNTPLSIEIVVAGLVLYFRKTSAFICWTLSLNDTEVSCITLSSSMSATATANIPKTNHKIPPVRKMKYCCEPRVINTENRDVHYRNTKQTCHANHSVSKTVSAWNYVRYSLPVLTDKTPNDVLSGVLTHSINGFVSLTESYVLLKYGNDCQSINCYICRMR